MCAWRKEKEVIAGIYNTVEGTPEVNFPIEEPAIIIDNPTVISVETSIQYMYSFEVGGWKKYFKTTLSSTCINFT